MLMSLFCVARLAAQQDPMVEVIKSLHSLPGTITTFYPTGALDRARHVQAMLEEGLPFYQEQLGLNLQVSLALLGPAEWRADNPQYTLPGGAPYSQFLPGVERVPGYGPVMVLPAESGHALSEQVRRVWKASPELAALGPNADDVADRFATLVGFHELGHVYARADSVVAAEGWFNEFIATYLAYAFLRSRYPDEARLWQGVGQALVKYLQPREVALKDMFGRGTDIYVWYQSSLQMRVHDVYEREGMAFYFQVRKHRAELGPSPGRVPLIQTLEGFSPGFLEWERRFHSSTVPPAPGDTLTSRTPPSP